MRFAYLITTAVMPAFCSVSNAAVFPLTDVTIVEYRGMENPQSPYGSATGGFSSMAPSWLAHAQARTL